jgi:hypothetical protein|eukprot:SAG25_NODE_207_length_11874_cov_27.396773_16_plen_88_part_00
MHCFIRLIVPDKHYNTLSGEDVNRRLADILAVSNELSASRQHTRSQTRGGSGGGGGLRHALAIPRKRERGAALVARLLDGQPPRTPR